MSDRHGKMHALYSLCTGQNLARQVLLIFIQYVFCDIGLQDFRFYVGRGVTVGEYLVGSAYFGNFFGIFCYAFCMRQIHLFLR